MSCPHQKFLPNEQRAGGGGCALRGAKLALQPITDVLHLVHGTRSCLGHVWASRPTLSSGATLHRLSLCTDLDELDLIMGSDAKLEAMLADLVRDYQPAAIMVYQSCLTAMQGVDLGALCAEASRRLDCPIHAVDLPGFAAGKQAGHRQAATLLAREIIGRREPERRTATDVAVIGEFNVLGEVAALEQCFTRLGIRLLASIPGDGRYGQIASAHRARVVLDLCSQALPDLASHLQHQYGLPVIRGSLYGSRPFADTLRQLVAALIAQGAPIALDERCERYLAEQAKRLQSALARYRPLLVGKRAMLYLGGSKTWALLDDLQQAGVIIAGVSLHKCSNADKQRHQAYQQSRGMLWPDQALNRLLERQEVDIVLTGGGMKYQAQQHGIPCLEMSHERHHNLLGVEGTMALLQRMQTLLQAPIWRQQALRPLPLSRAISLDWQTPGDAEGLDATTRIVDRSRRGAMAPFSLSQPMGALLALQGIAGCRPLLCGAAGCTASGTIFLSRYFREPLVAETLGMDEVATVFGPAKRIHQQLCKPAAPGVNLTALIHTGLDLMQGSMQGVNDSTADPAASSGERPMPYFSVEAPDFQGSLQDGWGKAIAALLRHLLPNSGCRPTAASSRPPLLILPGSHLMSADLRWLSECAAHFGIEAILLPDIGSALDGGNPTDPDRVLLGGTSTEALGRLAECSHYLALGSQMDEAVAFLRHHGLTGLQQHALTGVQATDRIVSFLADYADCAIPMTLRRERNNLIDTLRDHAISLAACKALIVAEPDLLADLAPWLAECGMTVPLALTSGKSGARQKMAKDSGAARRQTHDRPLPVEEIWLGADYAMLEREPARLTGCDLLLAPASAADLARQANLAHYEIGLHEAQHFNHPLQGRLGYLGAQRQLCRLLEILRA